MANLLEIDSVIKSYGSEVILTDIYLKCQTGEIVGMLGRNGTGKTTLLKILFGTLRADNKFIRIDGQYCNQPYKDDNEICYLPQESFLPKRLTVEKITNLYLGEERVEAFLDDPLLLQLRKSKSSDLSGGELKYFEVKLLLNLDAKFVLLDEPFNEVSPLVVEQIKVLITEASKTKGIILTDHDYRNVLNIANRFCLIYDGGIKEIKDTQELVKWGYLYQSEVEK